MEQDEKRNRLVGDIKEFHRQWMEELDFILKSMERISSEDRQMIQQYMDKTVEYIKVDESMIPSYRTAKREELEEYESLIKETKEDIKYLKKLRKRKEELEEKKEKRYKLLRKLYKEGRLDPELEGEYVELKDEMKYRRKH